jgi:hypothetical protein
VLVRLRYGLVRLRYVLATVIIRICDGKPRSYYGVLRTDRDSHGLLRCTKLQHDTERICTVHYSLLRHFHYIMYFNMGVYTPFL